MKLQKLCGTAIVALAVSVLSGVAAQAAPITMTTSGGGSTAVLDGVIGSFDLTLHSGETTTNTLVFQIEGNPPAMGVAAIVFDGATILSASEIAGSDPHNLLTGFAAPSTGMAAGVLIDMGAPSSARFQIVLSTTPTTARLYSLNLTNISSLYRSTTWNQLAIDKTDVRFSTAAAIPEPGAALCFGAGMAFVASRLRRR
jgi:hypothetical protein